MTTQELREAAERVSRMNAGERSRIIYEWGDGKLDDERRTLELKRINDYKTIADAYLAEHPADAIREARIAAAKEMRERCYREAMSSKTHDYNAGIANAIRALPIEGE